MEAMSGSSPGSCIQFSLASFQEIPLGYAIEYNLKHLFPEDEE